MTRTQSCSALLSILAIPALVRADQAVVTDVTYTHSADTTSDSHYRVKPGAGTPADWTKPVDYTKGSVHVLLDVKTKPAGDTPTKFQICFEGTPDYACTAQAPTYTKTGKYEWDTNFADLWYGGDVDWTKGIGEVALILKDTNNGKPQGDPKYVPSDLRVQVTLVSAGAKFTPTGDAGAGGAAGGGNGGQGGRAGGGGRSAGGSGGLAAGSGGAVAAGTGGSAAGSGGRAAPVDAGVPPISAGSSAPPPAVAGSAGRAIGGAGTGLAGTPASGTSGATGTTTSPVVTAGTAATTPPAKDDSGCNSSGATSSGSAALILASLLLLHRRRRQAQR